MPPGLYRYAFGDETGDPGFAFERGSTRYWVFTLLLIEDPEPLRQRIEDLHAEVGIPTHVEFKFHKTSDSNRLAFLAAIKAYSFQGHALVVDKMHLSPEWRSLRDVGFYGAFVAELVRRIPPGELGETVMVLDQFGPPGRMLRELRSRLQTPGGRQSSRLFKKILLKRSRGENLIQCADMVAGALMREISDGDRRFFDLVREKVTVWRL